VTLATAIFAAALFIRVACFTGLIASDDLGYSHYASQISDGSYRLDSHHYATRYGVIIPVAALYSLFGIHEWTTVALPLFCSSLAAAFSAVIAARLSAFPVGWMAGLLMATFPVNARYATILVPEPFLEAVVVAGVLLFLLAETQDSRMLGMAAGVSLALSYLTKEPGAFVVMAVFAFALLRRQWRLATLLLVGVTFVIAGEFIWYWSQSGDLLFRLQAMTTHNRTAMAIAANENLSYRLLKAYPRMMLIPNIDFGLHSLLAVVLSALALLRWRVSKSVLFLLLWASIPFLYLNFGTSSIGRYVALPVAPRYISLVYPPLFVLSAMVLHRWACSRVRKWIVGITFAVTCVAGVTCAVMTCGTGYRTEHVDRLKDIAVVARSRNAQICEFTGPDSAKWQQVLQIVAPDRVGCSDATLLRVVPDSNGLPMSKSWRMESSRLEL